jgi:hypothetical protein
VWLPTSIAADSVVGYEQGESDYLKSAGDSPDLNSVVLLSAAVAADSDVGSDAT